MPNAAPRVCNQCGRQTPTGHTCPCKPAYATRTPIKGRPLNTRKWGRYRQAWLRLHPICNYPDCRNLAVTVDHITPLAEGGPMWDRRNHQSLCDHHHKLKTTADAIRGKTRQR